LIHANPAPFDGDSADYAILSAGQFADYSKIPAFDPNLLSQEQRLDWQHPHGYKQQPNPRDSRLLAAEQAIGCF
jgi:hypothetical protein